MTRDKIKKITEELDNYFTTTVKVEPLIYLYGEEGEGEDYAVKIKPLSIQDQKSVPNLLKVMQEYSARIKRFIEGGDSLKDLEKDDDSKAFFYKQMDLHDSKLTKDLSSNVNDSLNFSDFIKPNKYKNAFFVIEISLDQSRNKKIILLKSVIPTYYAKKSKCLISPFDDTQKVRFLNKEKEIIFDSDFDISAFVDTTGSFFFITDRKKFEDLYKYHDKYESAYEELSKKIDFIDWNTPAITLTTKRSCYSIVSGFGDKLVECVKKVKYNLKSADSNDIKKALNGRNIRYVVNVDDVRILPQTTSDLRYVLKIIKDGIATTHLLERTVIGSDFEEIE